MAQTEPAALDMWGATWSGDSTYVLHPSARRYEQYEISFAAKARADPQPEPPFFLFFSSYVCPSLIHETLRLPHLCDQLRA